LNKDFIVLDCKSIPAANSLKNNKVTWKNKEIKVIRIIDRKKIQN
jgi:hypothetical protein